MGCMFSTAAAEGSDGSIFRVSNVDSQGVELNRGKIKVAASDLILYQKGKEPIHWPLKYLRRYGFDAELFSFESGRQCHTGQGIYAFKCHHAEDLFVTVQETIQRAGEQDRLRGAGARVGGGGGGVGGSSHFAFAHPSGHPTPLARPDERNDFMFTSSGQRGRPVSGDVQYVNGVLTAAAQGSPEYINLGSSPRLASEAYPIDEFAPLIDFLNRPGANGGGEGVRGRGRGRVNYTVIEHQSSNENLAVEEGRGGATATTTTTTAQGAGPDPDPVTLPGGQGAEVDADDSDVFLAEGDGDDDGGACPTYMNIHLNEPSPPVPRRDEEEEEEGVSGGDTAVEGEGGSGEEGGRAVVAAEPPPPPPLPLPPVPASAYANLTMHGDSGGGGGWTREGGEGQQKPTTASYILVYFEHGASGGGGGGGGPGQHTPTTSLPTTAGGGGAAPLLGGGETSSYAKIDFNKTEAICYSTRGGTDAQDEPGARKTRHNSSIGV